MWGSASWTLDADGLVLKENLPAGQSRAFAYDANGQRSSVTQNVTGSLTPATTSGESA